MLPIEIIKKNVIRGRDWQIWFFSGKHSLKYFFQFAFLAETAYCKNQVSTYM